MSMSGEYQLPLSKVIEFEPAFSPSWKLMVCTVFQSPVLGKRMSVPLPELE